MMKHHDERKRPSRARSPLFSRHVVRDDCHAVAKLEVDRFFGSLFRVLGYAYQVEAGGQRSRFQSVKSKTRPDMQIEDRLGSESCAVSNDSLTRTGILYQTPYAAIVSSCLSLHDSL